MKTNCNVESTIKPLDDLGLEYIGYISFTNPFQNIYCEISESKEKLEKHLAKKIKLLKNQFMDYGKIEHIHKA